MVDFLLSVGLLFLLLQLLEKYDWLDVLEKYDWLDARPAITAVIFYGLFLICTLTSAAIAWQEKAIIGAEEHEHGFFGGPDPSDYTPIYQGEDNWIWLMLLLPIVLFLALKLTRLSRYASVRRWLAALYLPWIVVAICFQQQFFNLSKKPFFDDKELTIPRRY